MVFAPLCELGLTQTDVEPAIFLRFHNGFVDNVRCVAGNSFAFERAFFRRAVARFVGLVVPFAKNLCIVSLNNVADIVHATVAHSHAARIEYFSERIALRKVFAYQINKLAPYVGFDRGAVRRVEPCDVPSSVPSLSAVQLLVFQFRYVASIF